MSEVFPEDVLYTERKVNPKLKAKVNPITLHDLYTGQLQPISRDKTKPGLEHNMRSPRDLATRLTTRVSGSILINIIPKSLNI